MYLFICFYTGRAPHAFSALIPSPTV
uniref:Uncharacterized protein n=1 Tax=Anguilla anguilla TaxID=7936 RepID=A0A0E9P780_ANGAN